MTINLPHNYKPRAYQLPILKALDNGVKRAVWVVHRRGGKDVTILNYVIKELAKSTKTCFYVFPSYAQAKKAIWDAINSDGFRIIDYIPTQIIAQKNAQEMKVRFKNGSLLQLIGSDNIDSIVGTNPSIIVFSEYALQDPSAWDYLRPILKVNKGVAIFISTPRGRNHFWDMFRLARDNEEWFCELLTVEDTDVLTQEDIEQERKENMSEELIQQEYYCSFDRGVEGSYYAKLLLKMEQQGRITELFYDEYKVVHTAWDLGWDDSTAVIFFQIDAGSVKIIDYEEHNNKTLAQMKSIIASKPYRYGYNLFPHDVEQIDGLSTGCTRREILEDLQIPVTTVKRNLIADGIESVKALMSSRLMISTRCDKLLKAIESYHKDYDMKNKVYSNKPRHDWSSHACDALRYMSEGLSLINAAQGSVENDYKALRNFWGS